jgi:hypothetical protein
MDGWYGVILLLGKYFFFRRGERQQGTGILIF